MLISLALSALLSVTSFAGTSRNLVFRKGGELRILQLTDLHLRPEVPQETARVLSRIDYLVETERPDFIAITGDVLWGKPARGVLRTFLDRMDSYGIPYTFVYGNHDREQDIPLSELSETIAAAKNSINCVDGSGALADLRIPVLSSDGSGKEMADIYMLDSQDYTLIKGAGCYGYFRLDQVAWMRQQCEEATSRNGGVNVPSLAFFHIPLPEFNRVWEIKGRKVIGQRIEESAAPELNTG
ncbi:MAG: metallophosphoesterase, partial [Bacteroidales bacterium]|nr:metallophosphoesterase [Bacteroidales bacterium]